MYEYSCVCVCLCRLSNRSELSLFLWYSVWYGQRGKERPVALFTGHGIKQAQTCPYQAVAMDQRHTKDSSG